MTKLQIAEQMRKALQLYCRTLSDDDAMIVPAVFDAWSAGMSYSAGDMLRYGQNAVGDPQLYRVVLAHTSQADWPPDAIASLYTPIGLDEDGYPVWAQPTGAHDAYNTGDIVNYNGSLYICLIDGNVYAPDVYPAGWELYTE